MPLPLQTNTLFNFDKASGFIKGINAYRSIYHQKEIMEWGLIATIVFRLKVFSKTMTAKMIAVNTTNTT